MENRTAKLTLNDSNEGELNIGSAAINESARFGERKQLHDTDSNLFTDPPLSLDQINTMIEVTELEVTCVELTPALETAQPSVIRSVDAQQRTVQRALPLHLIIAKEYVRNGMPVEQACKAYLLFHSADVAELHQIARIQSSSGTRAFSSTMLLARANIRLRTMSVEEATVKFHLSHPDDILELETLAQTAEIQHQQ